MIMNWVVGAMLAIAVVATFEVTSKLSNLRAETATLSSEVASLNEDLAASKNAVQELTGAVDVLTLNEQVLKNSIESYVVQLDVDSKSITELKRKIANVQDEDTRKCFNQTMVPVDVLNSLYPKSGDSLRH